ncbi:pseudouridine synthase [Phaeocystidibacter marisrubri]|uniref:Pseudouridine synthase n=1 Tax=Phaeocystidibacter marisrubri TaxID=1577780 RepID=A0A6L3ZDI9_9FLAO|nr:rRNA pseudouridine synthase [Phaeocystidibacter marisrubri]GGH71369.1 hypothetical protein GCM10011318_14310 [Phaeocystidibacter marisrubri]
MNRKRPTRGGANDRNKRNDDAPRHPRGPQARDSKKSGGKGRTYSTDAPKKFYAPKRKQAENLAPNKDEMRLNRFLSISGICSRREADKFIEAGLVTVNGKVITELGVKVKTTDDVRYNGETIKAEKKVYLLLNKPKGFLTTMDDPKARKTVMELVGAACKERIYPVGRLDRATTGVILFTNDGDVAKKLTHPSHGARKIYQVQLDKNLKRADFDAIIKGVELEDGVISPDALSYLDERSKSHIGIEIHSGKNRIVRRIFESFGYEVVKLDRTSFAGLTKKGLNRGHYRFLRPDEINFLKTR